MKPNTPTVVREVFETLTARGGKIALATVGRLGEVPSSRSRIVIPNRRLELVRLSRVLFGCVHLSGGFIAARLR
jgi:hypothetical protein